MMFLSHSAHRLTLPDTVFMIVGVSKYWAGFGGTGPFPTKFEHIFVAVITFPPFLLCRYFYYQLVAYCVCFKMICKTSL